MLELKCEFHFMQSIRSRLVIFNLIWLSISIDFLKVLAMAGSTATAKMLHHQFDNFLANKSVSYKNEPAFIALKARVSNNFFALFK